MTGGAMNDQGGGSMNELTSPPPLIVAKGIVKGYKTPAGEVSVLRGLDLEVEEREMLAITGASGVGKSTLLHVLGTLDRPDAGSLDPRTALRRTTKQGDLAPPVTQS